VPGNTVNISVLLKGVQEASASLKKVEGSLKDVQKVQKSWVKSLDLKGTADSFLRNVKRMTIAATAMGGFLGYQLVRAGADFDQAMARSLAIMGDVSNAMRVDMVNAAREVAKVTSFSAVQAAESYFYLASAGLDAKQSIAALPVVAQFAQAGAFDMALATDLLTDAQSALGLTIRDDVIKNMENMIRTSDVLVKANTLANATVQQFSEALTTRAGAALKILNKDMEEGVAVLAAMADQGIKGAEAGTRLDVVLRDLQKASIKNRSEFKRLGIDVFDASGEMVNMASIIGDMEVAFASMSDEQLRTTLITLGFQDRSIASTLTLIGLSKEIERYEKGLRNAGKTTEDVAKKQLDNFWDQLGLLKSRLQDVGLTIWESFGSVIKGDIIPTINDMVESIEKNREAISIWVTEGWEKLKKGTEGLIQDLPKLASAIKGIVSAIGGLVDKFLGLPAWVQEVGIVAAIIGGKKIRAVLIGIAAMSVLIEKVGGQLSKLGVPKDLGMMNKIIEDFAEQHRGIEITSEALGDLSKALQDAGMSLDEIQKLKPVILNMLGEATVDKLKFTELQGKFDGLIGKIEELGGTKKEIDALFKVFIEKGTLPGDIINTLKTYEFILSEIGHKPPDALSRVIDNLVKSGTVLPQVINNLREMVKLITEPPKQLPPSPKEFVAAPDAMLGIEEKKAILKDFAEFREMLEKDIQDILTKADYSGSVERIRILGKEKDERISIIQEVLNKLKEAGKNNLEITKEAETLKQKILEAFNLNAISLIEDSYTRQLELLSQKDSMEAKTLSDRIDLIRTNVMQETLEIKKGVDRIDDIREKAAKGEIEITATELNMLIEQRHAFMGEIQAIIRKGEVEVTEIRREEGKKWLEQHNSLFKQITDFEKNNKQARIDILKSELQIKLSAQQKHLEEIKKNYGKESDEYRILQRVMALETKLTAEQIKALLEETEEAVVTMQSIMEVAVRGVADAIKSIWMGTRQTFKDVWKGALNTFVDVMAQMIIQAHITGAAISVAMAAATAGISLVVGMLATIIGGGKKKIEVVPLTDRLEKVFDEFIDNFRGALGEFAEKLYPPGSETRKRLESTSLGISALSTLQGFLQEGQTGSVYTTVEEINVLNEALEELGVATFNANASVLVFSGKLPARMSDLENRIVQITQMLSENLTEVTSLFASQFNKVKGIISDIGNEIQRLTDARADFQKSINEDIQDIKRRFMTEGELYKAAQGDVNRLRIEYEDLSRAQDTVKQSLKGWQSQLEYYMDYDPMNYEGVAKFQGLIEDTSDRLDRVNKDVIENLDDLRGALTNLFDAGVTALDSLASATVDTDVDDFIRTMNELIEVGILGSVPSVSDINKWRSLKMESDSLTQALSDMEMAMSSLEPAINELIRLGDAMDDFIDSTQESIDTIRMAGKDERAVFDAIQADIAKLQDQATGLTGEAKIDVLGELRDKLVEGFEAGKAVMETAIPRMQEEWVTQRERLLTLQGLLSEAVRTGDTERQSVYGGLLTEQESLVGSLEDQIKADTINMDNLQQSIVDQLEGIKEAGKTEFEQMMDVQKELIQLQKDQIDILNEQLAAMQLPLLSIDNMDPTVLKQNLDILKNTKDSLSQRLDGVNTQLSNVVKAVVDSLSIDEDKKRLQDAIVGKLAELNTMSRDKFGEMVAYQQDILRTIQDQYDIQGNLLSTNMLTAQIEAKMLSTLSAISLLGRPGAEELTSQEQEFIKQLTGLNATLSNWGQVQIALAESISEFNTQMFPQGIPKYAEGGLVTRPHLAMVGEVPEVITPLSKISTKGGDTIVQNNFQGPVIFDEISTVHWNRQLMKSMRREGRRYA